MLKIRYAVCDDDGMICDAVSDRVCAILEKYGLTVFCERFTSPDALCRRFRDGEVPYDLLFLDIDMPGMSGLNLAKIVRQKVGEKIDIVFVSNREDQVFEAFGVHPFGFVRKSNFTRDLTDTLRSYMDLRVKSDSCLAIQTQNNSVTRQLQISDIVYIESYRYHQIIYMADGEEIKIRLTMEELETDTTRGIPAADAADLATGGYIRDGRTIIICGPTGTGKSYFACALGERACRQGVKTLYFTMNTLIENLRLVRLEGREANFFRKLSDHGLVIIDDFGMVRLEGQTQHDFEQIIDDRYNRKALILTSQLPVADWYGVFQSELIAEACLDRIAHKSRRFLLSGESLRKKY